MKKLQSILVLVLVLAATVMCLASCGQFHFDADSDGICDICKTDLNKETCTDHVDENSDGICDDCEAEIEQEGEKPDEGEKPGEGEKPDEGENPGDEAPAEYTVKFDFNNDAVKDIVLAIRDKKVTEGNAVAEPEVNFTDANPDNWKVLGWYLDADCTDGNEWDFDVDTVDSNITLYAKWVSTPLRKVTYMYGYDEPTLTKLLEVDVEDGLTAARYDSRISGHEILGYYKDAQMTEEYDFDSAVTSDLTLYIKISQYLYIGAEELAGFGTNNATATLAPDKSTVSVLYTLADNYIQNKQLNIDMNGYEWIEVVYKAPAGSRIDVFWIGQHSDGSYVDGKNDYNTRTQTVGITSFGCTFETDSDGFTHMKFQITKTRRHQDYYQGTDHMPIIEDLAKIVGFRLDLDGDQGAEGVAVEFKYVKAYGEQKILNRVTYKDGEKTVGFDNLPVGAAPKGLVAEEGYKYEYYADPEMTIPYDMTAVVSAATTVYVKKVEHNVTVTYAGDVSDSKTQAGGTKFQLLDVQTGKVMVYYADAEMTVPYHVESNVTDNVTVYVDVVDLPVADGHISMNGEAIKTLFTEHGGNDKKATSIEVDADGNYVLTGPNGTFVMLYATEYALGTDNMIAITYKGTLANVFYVDNTFTWASLNAYVKTVNGEGDWKIAQIDLAAAGKDGSFKGLRFDTNGSITVKSITSMVKPTTAKVTYAGGYTGTEEVALGGKISGSAVFGKQVLGYYTDAEMTTKFDISTPINEPTTIYVKTSDYFYLGANELATFDNDGGMTASLVEGQLVMADISTASYIGENNMTNLYAGGVNTFYVRVKFNDITNVKNVWLFIIGNSPASETEDLKDKTSYANIEGSATFATPDADGYYILKFDMSADSKLGAAGIDKIRRMRIWVTPMSADKPVTATIDYIASENLAPPPAEFTVTYAGDVEAAETVTSGQCATASNVKAPFGKRIDGYYTDAAFTTKFNFASPITEATTVYVKLSDYFYLGANELATFDNDGGMTASLVEGQLVMADISTASYIGENNMTNLYAGGVNTFYVRVKFNDITNVKNVWLFIIGNSPASETEDLKDKTSYANIEGSATFATPDADGYYILKFDMSADSKLGAAGIDKIRRMRIWVTPMSADEPVTATIDYIASAVPAKEVSAEEGKMYLDASYLGNYVSIGEKTVVNGDELNVKAPVTDASCRVITNSNAGGIPEFNATTKVEMRVKYDPAKVDQFVLFLQESGVEGGTASGSLISVYYTLSGKDVADADGYYTIVFDLSAKLSSGSTGLTKTTRIMLDVSPASGVSEVEFTIDYIRSI